MDSGDSNEVAMAVTTAMEAPDTTVEIKIKTLDSQTYTLRVNKCVPVPALKEQIATVTGVVSEQQRLICRGRVLKDDDLLSAYHVEDGHTLHLVVRQPSTSSSSPSTNGIGSENAADNPGPNPSINNDRIRGVSIVLEAVNLDQGDHTGEIITSILRSLGGLSNAGNIRSAHRELNSQRQDPSATGADISNSTPSQFHTAPFSVGSDQPQAGFPSNLGPQQSNVVQDSLTTITQYLRILRDEFASGVVQDNHVQGSGAYENSTQNLDFQSSSTSGQAGLPSPSFLANTLLATRDFLIEIAGRSLSELSGQLANEASIADPSIRMNIQSSAAAVGRLFRNLGPLLLEVARTIMTLRMGQTPSEAIINSGPAVFISPSGPNPMMVQPFPFVTGSNGGLSYIGNSVHGVENQRPGPTLAPRAIEIQIHRGRTVPVSSSFQDDDGGSQHGEQIPAGRNSAGAGSIRAAVATVSGNASSSGDSGIRVVPMRTVIAVPAGGGPPSSDSSGSGVGLLYPLLSRMQHSNPGNLTNVQGSQTSPDSQPLGPESADHIVQQNDNGLARDNVSSLNSSAGVSVIGSSANESTPYQGTARVYISSRRRVQPSSHNDNVNQTQNGQRSSQGAGVSVFDTLEHLIRNMPGSHIDDVNQTQNGQHSGQDAGINMLDRIDDLIRNATVGEEIHSLGSRGQHNLAETSATVVNTNGDVHAQETPVVEEQAVFFSNLVHQLMPHLSQVRTSDQGTSNEREPEDDSMSIEQQHDQLPDHQSSKRQKRD